MARYIDADNIEYYARYVGMDEFAGLRTVAYMEDIDNMPTADVVPKSEVEFLQKTIAENAQKALEVTLEEIEKANTEVARGIFEDLRKKRQEIWSKGKHTMFEAWCKAEEEVKKKYTEEK